ncbi:MAG: hypothetical protein LBU40_03985 [Methanobrevibacter sp.]|jgi:5-methylcytosine-specific restriction enzyme subunit McrC|nr:hypothetical protein [Methanobrevibacter sp.]
MSENQIPIKNIFHMLSYAYENLRFSKDIETASEDFENIHDLLGAILVNAVNSLIKRGFFKEYINKNEDLSTIRGKININESIKRRTFIYKKLNSSYDEFSEDIIFNRIIKSSLSKLIRFSALDDEVKKDLKKSKLFFHNVNDIQLNKQVFNSLKWNRNNKYYRGIISICELIYYWNLPDESSQDDLEFKEFLRDRLYNLFEKFVLNFYKKKYKELNPSPKNFKFNYDDSFDNSDTDYLPIMKTDVVLENKENNKILIIDTKFYKKILQGYNINNKKKLSSGHLYQIKSYVKTYENQSDKEISGMLLYADTYNESVEIDFQYKIDENIYYIKTLKLDQEWKEIENDLKEIAKLVN